MRKKILVTGGSGFVGRQVVPLLIRRGANPVVVIRKGGQKLFASIEGCEFIETEDLFSESVEWWVEKCSDIDTVIHLAWYAEPGKYLDSPINMDCFFGSINLAKGALKAGVRRFVGIGTCLEYDLSAGLVSIDTSLKPLTPYAAAKAALFLALDNWLAPQSMDFVWCRLFYLYGEGEDSRRLVPFIRSRLEQGKAAALTTGLQIRDYLDVKVAGEQLVECALGNQKGPVNICSGVPVSIRALAESIADEYGRRDLLDFGARPDSVLEPQCVIGKSSLEIT